VYYELIDRSEEKLEPGKFGTLVSLNDKLESVVIPETGIRRRQCLSSRPPTPLYITVPTHPIFRFADGSPFVVSPGLPVPQEHAHQHQALPSLGCTDPILQDAAAFSGYVLLSRGLCVCVCVRACACVRVRVRVLTRSARPHNLLTLSRLGAPRR
jgi:hypothetical protein